MNKQPKMTDTDKLLKWAEEQKRVFRESEGYSETYCVGRISSYDHFINELDKGTFDPDPIPLPTIKPGDTRQLLHNTINVMTDQQVRLLAKSLGLEVAE